jgi:hypothetical protein
MKYMKRLGVSIHMAAAYVIARRAMGFNALPKEVSLFKRVKGVAQR